MNCSRVSGGSADDGAPSFASRVTVSESSPV